MGRSSCDLLRQHGCNHLPFAIEIECALNPDQDVVGGAQPNCAAPHDASALMFDHAPNGRGVEIDRRHGLHGVGGS